VITAKVANPAIAPVLRRSTARELDRWQGQRSTARPAGDVTGSNVGLPGLRAEWHCPGVKWPAASRRVVAAARRKRRTRRPGGGKIRIFLRVNCAFRRVCPTKTRRKRCHRVPSSRPPRRSDFPLLGVGLRRRGILIGHFGSVPIGEPTGKMSWNRAPFSPSDNAERLPPWRSTIMRQMASPNPIPSGFVVMNGSNMPLSRLGLIPGPESSTAMIIASGP
jgi:hypothetical protein